MADGQTLDEFQKILDLRVKYLHQTSRESIVASAISVLKSIRVVTKRVKPSKIKKEIKLDGTLYPSYTGGKKKQPCVRYVGSGLRYSGQERLYIYDNSVKFDNAFVYRWTFETFKGPRQYLIIAEDNSQAKDVVKRIIDARLKHYAGLAKRALSVLMMKTSTLNVSDKNINAKTQSKALSETKHIETVARNDNAQDGKYILHLEDNLKYAISAVEGGKSAVQTAMKRALNGIMG